MILDERYSVFFNAIHEENTPFLNEIEKEAKAQFVPIIRKEMQGFIKMLLALKKPMRILEVGTAVGFSSLLMAEYGPEGVHIDTIENYEERIKKAKKNLKKSDYEDSISLLEGDASIILKELKEPYDLIFMDAAKGQYIHFLEDVLRLLKVDGVLISDNILQDGDIIESKFAIPRRNRTIHRRMRDYLYVLHHREELMTSVLPLGDGITVSVKWKG